MLEARHTKGSGTVLALRNLTVQEERKIDADMIYHKGCMGIRAWVQ